LRKEFGSGGPRGREDKRGGQKVREGKKERGVINGKRFGEFVRGT